MPEIVLRKSAIITETTFHEGGPAPEVPLRRAAAMSVIANPYAGIGGPGTRLDVPLTHANASYVRSHFDAMEVGLPDGPKADELLLVLVMSTGSRIHARVGGLKSSEVEGKDGLR